MFLILFFSQYLRNVKCPFPQYNRQQGWTTRRLDIFVLLPVRIYILNAINIDFDLATKLPYTLYLLT